MLFQLTLDFSGGNGLLHPGLRRGL